MKRVITVLFALLIVANINAQESREELQAMYNAKATEASALRAEANAIKTKIDAIPGGWDFGGLGIFGFDVSDNTSWYALDEAYSSQKSLGIGIAVYAKMDREKKFWNTDVVINMKQIKSKIYDLDSTTTSVTDLLNINSLVGYKLTKKLAVSGELGYSSTFLNLNDPGKLTMSVGATYLPFKGMTMVIHPFGYEVNFPSGDFVSSPGAKIGVNYFTNYIPGVTWNSIFSTFIPFSSQTNDAGVEFSASDLANWTWTNSFGLNLWRGMGIGFNFGLRKDKQLATQYRLDTDAFQDPDVDIADPSGNPLQFYYNLGLSYSF